MIIERVQRRFDRFLDEVDKPADLSDWALFRHRAQNVPARDPENADALEYLTTPGERKQVT